MNVRNSAPKPLSGYFQSVAGGSGTVNSLELQRCLLSIGLQLNKGTCVELIGMFGNGGGMDMDGFTSFFDSLEKWKTTFATFDRDRSGTLRPHELLPALRQMGHEVSDNNIAHFFHMLGVDNQIDMDGFIQTILTMTRVTELFKQNDTEGTGYIRLSRDELVSIAR